MDSGGALSPLSAAEFIARKTAQWERDRASGKITIWTKDIGRRGRAGWVRQAWTLHVQHNYPVKVLVIERLVYRIQEGERAFAKGAEPGDIEYRFGYYTVGRIGRADGRWVWGQFSPLIPHDDLVELLAKARADGTLLP